MLLNKVNRARIQDLQESTPANAQEGIDRKLQTLTASEEEERKKIKEQTRQPGILGLIQSVLSLHVLHGCWRLRPPQYRTFSSVDCVLVHGC
jgi:hypothetical protein